MAKTIIPEAALQQHIAVLGKTGSGKTFAAKAAIVEPLLERGRRVCIVDPTGASLIEYWRQRLGATGKRAIFDILVAAYPHAMPQAEVAQRSGIAIGGGTWRTYLGELRGLELITGRGELRASEDLFA